jgi:cytochrome c553
VGGVLIVARRDLAKAIALTMGNVMKNKPLAFVLGFALAASSCVAFGAESDASTKQAAAKIAVNLCSSCHGPGGNSISPTFPKLAGQQKLYVAAQLRALKGKTRADPEAHDYMWGIAGTIDDSMIEPLAEYYASQPPAPGKPGDPKLVAEGKRFFESGDDARKIQACAICHAADAQGQAIFPRLAGQHAAYIVRQLQVIQSNLRQAPIMHGIVTELKPDEMKALAEFLQSK